MLTGIETNDEACLQSIGQKIRINEVLAEKIDYCGKIGMNVFGSFVVGAPEENWDSLRRTIEYAKQVDAQCAATIMTPFPGTPMFYRAIEEGVLAPKMQYEGWSSYTATMRSYHLTCKDLTVARLWFRLETLIPFKLRRARQSGGAAAVRRTQLRLAPHYVVRQALRGYVWCRSRMPQTASYTADTSRGGAGSRDEEGAMARSRSITSAGFTKTGSIACSCIRAWSPTTCSTSVRWRRNPT